MPGLTGKNCSKCGTNKPLTEFNLEHGKPRAYCKACHRASSLAWAKANPDKRKAISKAFFKRRRERLGPPKKGGRPAFLTPEEAARRDTAAKRRWEQNNPARVLAKTRKYQAAKIRALPKWADLRAIEQIYERARVIGAHVDHIVPLQSPIVCGLHCESNLQLLPPAENWSKHNRRWPDMP